MHLFGSWLPFGGAVTVLLLSSAARAINLDISDEQSIKDAASTSTYAMMKYYYGNETGQIPGAFPDKWWEGAPLLMALLEYWHFTGDTTYNEELSVALQWQSGTDGDYMPSNYSSYLVNTVRGNDDQMFWGLAAMTAAELSFPDRSTGFSWLSLAQGVFNTQIKRWDTSSCGGGLRWQIWPYQSGYGMKNSISNGGLFQLSARLARYTGDAIYLQWANKIWDWSASSPLLSNSTWNVADSTNIDNDCSTQGNAQWTYNYGTYLMGAAYMYNHTNGTTQSQWLTAVNGLLNKTIDNFFLTGGIIEEYYCEPAENCNNNEVLFKGLTSTWLAFTALLVPSNFDRIIAKLQTSGKAAAASCTGHSNGTCGVQWYKSTWDGWMGMEEQISATKVFTANLINFNNTAPVTSKTGGNSTSNPKAGESDTTASSKMTIAVTTADKVGAGIVTAVFVAGWIGLTSFMILGG
ncbi:Glycosyl hydrolase, putative [Penicillium digitatum PHI26]|uniref:Mannan endo-1,6-alpha-mannosidase n=2 Tax=Penicillium digitatum TaxID=36651 RepID=K9FFS8_PEND2|nr:Glycosyl hydrolase, putative [Penicillium digitatum Pd1]EKV06618.1 Glycosyl hydrolase, putative [Penicillium digitatum Pd1]EKV08300.1 Glycosyl hydrolase, putative [Penicillium digitatum PHI26]